ncbi:DMT family transporter [Polaribacter undariae]|uniref:DMT family transporter n=1 Tax=Polaribacter sejongensis TaxID=985043 RepID=A0AAJ1VHH3_9FLAO|nr:DMT family transporter [Polaribacter undariae]MDN3620324.1 DMT family transporter [Polaribacter undariae]UWD32725.1 DMT family transporter [Polaribacter undariae]
MEVKKAIKYMLISTLAFACMNSTVKYLKGIPTFEIVFFRSLGSLFFTVGFLLNNKIPMIGKNNKLLILRAIAGTTSMSLFFMSIKYLSIGTAVSIRYIAPIFSAIFAVFLLKEKIKPLQWGFFVISLVGVFVLKGFDHQINTTGLFLVLLASVLSGLVYVIINKIGKSEHPLVVVNYFMMFATVLGGVLSINNWTTPKGIEWLFLLLLGIFGYVGQVFMTKAFQTASTNIVAPIKYFEVIYTATFGVFLFGEIYTFYSFLGITLIIGGLILNIWYKSKLDNS